MPEESSSSILDALMQTPWTPADIVHYGPTSRTIAIWSDITAQSVFPIISQLIQLEHQSHEPIKIHLCTDGGSLSAASALYDTMRMISSPIIITATGVCASAGLLLLLGGDKRYCTKNTQFFYHQPVMTGEVATISADMIKENTSEYLYQQIKYDSILRERTGISDDDWFSTFEGKISKYFDAEEAISYGFVDSVLPYKGE